MSSLKRWLRRAGYRWRRMRLSCKGRRDALAFAAAQRRLRRLEGRREAGKLDLFLLRSERLLPDPAGALRLAAARGAHRGHRGARPRPPPNVLGFWPRAGEFFHRSVEGRVDGAAVVAAVDAFLDWREAKAATPPPGGSPRPLWVVLDNASSHTSAHFRAQVSRWRQRGLRLLFLPAYCPELNAIERLWQEIKHRWLDLAAYTDWPTLKKMLAEVLDGIGGKYRFTSE